MHVFTVGHQQSETVFLRPNIFSLKGLSFHAKRLLLLEAISQKSIRYTTLILVLLSPLRSGICRVNLSNDLLPDPKYTDVSVGPLSGH